MTFFFVNFAGFLTDYVSNYFQSLVLYVEIILSFSDVGCLHVNNLDIDRIKLLTLRMRRQNHFDRCYV